jgi:GDP-L-fucose synthase
MPTNCYGPNDNFDLLSAHVLPALIAKFVNAVDLKQDSVSMWGSGNARREFIHSSDLANATLFAMEKYDSDLHLNVGTGVDSTIKELAEGLAEIAGFKGDLVWDKSKPDGTPRKVLDVTRLRNLGWKPTISLEVGIRETIQWFRNNRSKVSA